MINNNQLDVAITASVEKLQSLFGNAPEVAVVLGSGWAGAVSHVQDAKNLPYTELPAFPQPKVEGHVNEIVVGKIGAQRVIFLRGRAHTYESGECTGMAGALRTLKRWGVRLLLQTNASGSLRGHMPPGSLMLIADHINAPQRSPLVGEPGSQRFVDMSAAYDPELRKHALVLAKRENLMLGEGTYCWALGPQFETPAEIRMLQRLGAQAVGMSTVPETILARRFGLRVLALSMFTNMGCGLEAEGLSHAHTLATAQAAGEHAVPLLEAVIAGLVL
jgi:purine-nucleoside phosphorylase